MDKQEIPSISNSKVTNSEGSFDEEGFQNQSEEDFLNKSLLEAIESDEKDEIDKIIEEIDSRQELAQNFLHFNSLKESLLSAIDSNEIFLEKSIACYKKFAAEEGESSKFKEALFFIALQNKTNEMILRADKYNFDLLLQYEDLFRFCSFNRLASSELDNIKAFLETYDNTYQFILACKKLDFEFFDKDERQVFFDSRLPGYCVKAFVEQASEQRAEKYNIPLGFENIDFMNLSFCEDLSEIYSFLDQSKAESFVEDLYSDDLEASKMKFRPIDPVFNHEDSLDSSQVYDDKSQEEAYSSPVNSRQVSPISFSTPNRAAEESLKVDDSLPATSPKGATSSRANSRNSSDSIAYV